MRDSFRWRGLEDTLSASELETSSSFIITTGPEGESGTVGKTPKGAGRRRDLANVDGRAGLGVEDGSKVDLNAVFGGGARSKVDLCAVFGCGGRSKVDLCAVFGTGGRANDDRVADGGGARVKLRR